MRACWRWLALIVPLSLLPTCCRAQQRIVEEPAGLRALRGDTVRLKCRVEQQAGAVQWTKNGFGLGAQRDLPSYPRYSMVGSSALGEFHLEISDLQLSDEAVYQCQLGPSATQQVVSSRTANLTILARPRAPRLTAGSRRGSLEAVERRETGAVCVVDGARPAATIAWVVAADAAGSRVLRHLRPSAASRLAVAKSSKKGADESTAAPPPLVAVSERVSTNERLFTTRSELRFAPVFEDDGQYLVCLSNHETFEGAHSAGLRINLRYAPKVQVVIRGGSALREGGQAVVECRVDSEPAYNALKWYRDGQQLPETTETLAIAELSADDDGRSLECRVENAVGMGVGAITTDVLYGPRMTSVEERHVVDLMGSVTLSCDADGNPPPAISWAKVGAEQTVLHTGENFTISDIKAWQQGSYVCTAKVVGFPPALIKSAVFIKGAPRVTLPRSVEARAGDNVKIVCDVRGFPRPKYVSWYRSLNDQDYIDSAGRFENNQVPQSEGVANILRISRVEAADFGLYRCVAGNEKGSDSAVTRLIPHDPFPLYYVIPAVIACLALILLLVLALLLLSRKRDCRSKNSLRSADDQSDVTVKVEPLDGHSYPDMYRSATMENNAEANYSQSQDYMAVPQDNPDFDLLPPPYATYSALYARPSPHTPNGSFSRGSPRNARVTYSDGPLGIDDYPIGGESPLVYFPNQQQYQQTYQSFVPRAGGQPLYVSANGRADGQLFVDQYYPTSAAGVAPLASALETLHELPTPDAERRSPVRVAGSFREPLPQPASSSSVASTTV